MTQQQLELLYKSCLGSTCTTDDSAVPKQKQFRLLTMDNRTPIHVLSCLLCVLTTRTFGCHNVVGFTLCNSKPATRRSRLFLDGEGMAGGTKHLIGDVLRSLQPRYLSQVASSVAGNARGAMPINVPDTLLQDLEEKIPTWQELADTWSQHQQPRNDDFPSARDDKRLFGHKEPRVTLYRDSASWCAYSQKAMIALEEKQIPYQVIRIDMKCYGTSKPQEFLKIQPSGNLPCAVIDGKVYGESDDIVDAVDEIGDDSTVQFRPEGSQEQLAYLCDNGKYDSLERRLYSRWMWWLTGKRKPREYKELYLERLQEVEDALGENDDGPFFLGSQFSLADIRFIPFVERQIASLAYFKGCDLRDPDTFPSLCAWLDAMERRPSYLATKSDYYTHSHALPPQLSAECQFEPGCEDLRDAIDSVPLGNDDWDWEEPGWPNDLLGMDPRQEAAERLIDGNEKIVRFACRGAGTPGLPAVSAPLADPKSIINEDAVPIVDLLLRHVANSLLTSGQQSNLNVDAIFSETDNDTRIAIADCLCYLRARIGVPRDMSYPAATELRRKLLEVSREFRLGTERLVTT